MSTEPDGRVGVVRSRSRTQSRWRVAVVAVAVTCTLVVASCSDDDGASSERSTTTSSMPARGGGDHDATGGSAHDEPADRSVTVEPHTVVVRTELAPAAPGAAGSGSTPPGAKAPRVQATTTTTTAPTTTAPATTVPGSTTTTSAAPVTTTTTVLPPGCDAMANPLEVQVCEIVGARVHDTMASTDTPGMAVGVVLPPVDGGAPVQLEFHYGEAVAADGSTPATAVAADTHWEMGSETKLFTGLLLAQLAPTDADGSCAAGAAVCLDDPISKHLSAEVVDQIGPEKAAITLLQLATHTSGLPDDPPNLYAGCPTVSGGTKHEQCANWRALYTDDLLWKGVAQSELAFSPGQAGQWLYSDVGFAVLGAILADVADPGQPSNPFAEVVAERQTGPLGLTATGPEDDDDPLLAMGYEYASSGSTTTSAGSSPTVVPAPRWNNTAAFIAGGGFTTDLSDVTRYVAASLGYDPSDLTAALAETLVARTNGESSIMQMGLAWQLMSPTWFPTTYAFKNGGTYGFKSATVVVPTLGYGVTMLSNSPGAPDPVVTGIMSDLRPVLA